MRPLKTLTLRSWRSSARSWSRSSAGRARCVSLVLGPFLIMAIFGLGYSGYRRPLETVVVIPPESGLPTDVEALPGPRRRRAAHHRGRPDEAAAEQGLASGTIDVVLVAPADVEAQFRAGKQSVIEVVVDTVDPVRARLRGLPRRDLATAVNQGSSGGSSARARTYAIAAGEPNAAQIPPEVVAAPTKAELRNSRPVRAARDVRTSGRPSWR